MMLGTFIITLSNVRLTLSPEIERRQIHIMYYVNDGHVRNICNNSLVRNEKIVNWKVSLFGVPGTLIAECFRHMICKPNFLGSNLDI
jgi:hypothetical protein